MNTLRRTSTIALLAAALTLHLAAAQGATPLSDAYSFEGPVFDIEAMPDGSILVIEGTTVKRIGASGTEDVVTVPTIEGSPVNGVAAVDAERFFVTSGGLDLAMGAGVWLVVGGDAELIGDVEAFETSHDPDALQGNEWKQLACEDDSAQGFTAGPQSNPYHLTALSDGRALVADAAGNTLLLVDADGETDWIAVFDPPVDDEGDWRFLRTAEHDPDVDCYVQPVPTSVAVGPDGAYYVGELTGEVPVAGWSRVWRIEPDARHVVCPSDACEEVVSGLTSVVDVAFGPDGALYVAELDAAGWLSLIVGGSEGGAIKRCDVTTGDCEVVERTGGALGALTFDPSGQLWALENDALFGPGVATVRRVELELP